MHDVGTLQFFDLASYSTDMFITVSTCFTSLIIPSLLYALVDEKTDFGTSSLPCSMA